MRAYSGAIGGYFELEICNRDSLYHDGAIELNSGRNALEYILRCKRYDRILIPYYTCDVLLQPIKKLNVEYKFYHINDNFAPILNDYQIDDAILYTNYFGLNSKNVELLVKQYKNVIIDNAQAFFDQPLDNIPTFYSPRKFFGLPDGGFVYGANEIPSNTFMKDNSLGRMMHLLVRIEEGAEAGYQIFKENDSKLDNQPIKLMSNITHSLLSNVDFNDVLIKRLQNFNLMHQILKKTNKLTQWIDNTKITCPLVYPYWINNGLEFRNRLTQNKVYTASYWPNVLNWVGSNSIEFEFTTNIVCIPIDQRITKTDINKIIDLIHG